MGVKITNAPIKDLEIGCYLMQFDGGGEAAYDEQKFDDLKKRATRHLSARLPDGWSCSTETDEDGTFLVAVNGEDGAWTNDLSDVPWIIDGDEVERDRSGQGHAWEVLNWSGRQAVIEEALIGESIGEVVCVGGINYRLG